MTVPSVSTLLRTAALSAACLLQAPAQAGLVTGAWDPAFGPALPGLNWAAYAELMVPDNACTSLSGNQAISGDCAGARVLGVFLRLYDTGVGAPDWDNPATYFSSLPDVAAYGVCDSSVAGDPAFTSRCNGNFGNYFNLQALRIEGGSVAGLQTGVATSFITQILVDNVPFQLPTSAQGHQFTLDFSLNGPMLTCTTCPGGPVPSQLDGLRQYLVTYTSEDRSAPKFTNSNGDALGVRLDERGRVLGQSTSIDGPLVNRVPEPGSLALVAAALAAAALGRRRRA